MTMRRGVLVALLACCLAGWTGPATARAQSAAPDSSAAADWERNVGAQRSWVGRILHRYFGRAPRSGVDLGGRAVQAADRFAPYAGRRIEVVIVYPVLRFDTAADDSLGTVAGLTHALWSYTRESVVRQYLLFHAGDRVDPYKLADSERMLRQLEYMTDARVRVVPIGEGDTVAVVVETRDRFPLGVTGNVVTSDQYDGSLYWTNAFGVGLRVDGRAYVHRRRDPRVGFRWLLAKQNLAGTFIDVTGQHEDSWRRRSTALSLQRPLRHPAIRVVGGYDWLDLDLRDDGGLPRWYVSRDAWVGRVWELGEGDPFRAAARLGRRRTLTPAVSMAQLDFRDRPAVARDSLREYHNHRTWLGSLTYANLADLRTSYLYRMGETEDVPDGVVLKLTGGYQEGEFLRRALWYGQMAVIRVTGGGSVAWGSAGAGGFVRRGLFEDGVVSTEAGYITSMLGRGPWRQRFYIGGQEQARHEEDKPTGGMVRVSAPLC